MEAPFRRRGFNMAFVFAWRYLSKYLADGGGNASSMLTIMRVKRQANDNDHSLRRNYEMR
jgi:hypothetical protein